MVSVRELAALLVAVISIPFSNLVAQVAYETSVQQHLQLQPGQKIDIQNLPADVLNCDECRRRLGLPSLSKPIVEATKPTETRSIVNTLKVEAVAEASPKAEPQKDEEAATKPTLKQLGKLEEKPSSKPLTPDALRVEGVLTSPATQRIEIEILKRQLQERDAHLKQFSEMQSNVEERIDQLVRMNEELAKKDAGRQVELESKKAQEFAKLSSELIEAKQARIDAVASLRKEFASSKESAVNETQRTIVEQAKTVEAQQATIRKLEEQLATADKIQREDAKRLEKIHKELNATIAEKTRVLSELSKRMKLMEETDKLEKAKKIESARATPSAIQPKAEEPAKAPSTVKAIEPAKLEQNPAPVENEANKKRRAF